MSRGITGNILGATIQSAELDNLSVTAAKLAAMNISALTSHSTERLSLVGVYNGFLHETGVASTTSTSYGTVGDAVVITAARFVAPTGTALEYRIAAMMKNQTATSCEINLRDISASSDVSSSELTSALSNQSDFQISGALTLTDGNRHQFQLKISGSGTTWCYWPQILVFALVD